VTILIVAISLMAILAMSAIAIDIVALYVSEGDAQRAADAAALAGAKTFVSSGFTSGQLGDPTLGGAQSLVCNGSSGYADLEAQAVANNNPVAGITPTTVTTSCAFPDNNPQITVTVQRTGLPSFFARIWGGGSATVARTAKAEAYNPSGQSVPIQVRSVKPWLIPNCDPACASGGFFFDNAYNIVNNGVSFLGRTIQLTHADPGTLPVVPVSPASPLPVTGQYYPLNIPISPPTPACPSTSAVSCSNLNTGGGHADYRQNIACSANFQFSCGQQVGAGQTITIDTDASAVIKNTTIEGTECLIHADTFGPLNSGQDNVQAAAIGTPVTIAGGYNNPNPSLTAATSISRSDSIVTVPVYRGNDLCPGGTCTQTAQVIGFLQLGIQYVDPAAVVNAVILNAAGCNPANSGTAVSGGQVSPIPVRLIQ
jgi:Putative Flp pilus-assembly TadE/G-like